MASNSNQTADIALALVDTLTTRFESSESRINNDIRRIEEKLQQTVELVKAISGVQAQTTAQQQMLSELRIAVRDGFTELREMVEGTNTRCIEGIGDLGEKINKIETDIRADLADAVDRIDEIEHKSRTWLNRGIGIWAVVVLIAGYVQYGATQIVKNFEEEKVAAKAEITKITNRLADIEQRLQFHEDGQPLKTDGTLKNR